MKKLYKKGTIHPTPPVILDQLSLLPATILTLAAALSLEDREVLAYLLSCSSNNYAGNKRSVHKTTTTTANYNSSSSSGGGGDHPPSFNCSCFRCYMSYWVRWDASPNRQLIHEIIDAFEEGLTMQQGKKEKSKRERRKSGGSSNGSNTRGSSGEFKKAELSVNRDEFSETDSVEDSSSAASGGSNGGGQSNSGEDDDGEVVEGLEKGSVRRLVSFLGEKIWSVVWN